MGELAMSEKSDSIAARLINRVFPRMPDFYHLINEQCDLAAEVMDEFVSFMSSGEESKATRVRQLEKKGDLIKARNIDVLNKAFSTPMDREDLYRAIVTIDHIINYAKTTVREMAILDVQPDNYALEMATQLQQGVLALQTGFGKLSSNPAAAEEDADAVRKAERRTEKAYRKALANLLDPRRNLETLAEHKSAVAALQQEGVSLDPHDESVALMFHLMSNTFKRREVYRHISNAADRLAHAGEVLHDIVVKIC